MFYSLMMPTNVDQQSLSSIKVLFFLIWGGLKSRANLTDDSFSCFSARPTDFDFLAVIGKGTFGKVKLKQFIIYSFIYD